MNKISIAFFLVTFTISQAASNQVSFVLIGSSVGTRSTDGIKAIKSSINPPILRS
jgi:hypothetical protein